MEENQIKLGVFLIVLIGTMLSIYINPNNWLPPILFFVLSIGGLIESINKRNFKILMVIIILIIVVFFNHLDIVDAILLFF